jgi:hypothetical protein
MTDKITDATRRTRGYWFIDGLAEIGGGILFVVISIPYLLWSLVPEGSRMAKLASSGRDVLLLLGIAIFYLVIRAVKLRSTYPRTGYVEEQRPARKQILTAGVFGVAGVLVFAGLMVSGSLLFPAFRQGLVNALAYSPAFFGLILILSQVILGFRTGLKRFYGLAGMAALVSLGLVMAAHFYLAAHPFDWTFIANSGPNDPMPAGSAAALTGLLHYVYTGVAIFAAIHGLAWLVSGLIVRRNYLCQNPVPQEEPDEQ